ncbi:MAG TPA: hypothetical protein VGX50_18680 [Longimicrobium sp.]|jgi:hypothetical protein|nr:hypothetical protein [Longimicrobium sp.]
MDEATRKRLEADGWKIGDTQEFLGLSDEEMQMIDARIALRMREDNGTSNPPGINTPA